VGGSGAPDSAAQASGDLNNTGATPRTRQLHFLVRLERDQRSGDSSTKSTKKKSRRSSTTDSTVSRTDSGAGSR
jgi:hypothetical protein